LAFFLAQDTPRLPHHFRAFAGGASFTYDANGNLTSDGTMSAGR